MAMAKIIKQKERDAVVRSLRSGVVPAIGLQHIQVGRYNEIKSFLADINNVADGGSAFRLVIGEYGSGKTFFLSLVRQIAIEKGLVTMSADLSPTKRLHGRDGLTRALLSALVASLSTRTRQEGNALEIILERLLSRAKELADDKGVRLHSAVKELLAELDEHVGGFSFAKVVEIYCIAANDGDEFRRQCAMRWLRCEYSTKTDAMRDLGVRDFISDNAFFSTLVLYSVLVRKAGYKGLYVCLDEMVNLYKITNATSRKANYEEVLSIVNATLQGSIQGLGIVMSGTPEFLTDTRRGLYSYEALRSRLAENDFGKRLGLSDFYSTVLRLPNLTAEEMFLLLKNLRNVFAMGDEKQWLVPDEALHAYLNHCYRKIGESYFRVPRNTIKGFIDLLSMLEQYPQLRWQDVIDDINIPQDRDADIPLSSAATDVEPGVSEHFSSFSL